MRWDELYQIYNFYRCFPNCNRAPSPTRYAETTLPRKYSVLSSPFRRRPTQKHSRQTKQRILQTMEKSICPQKSTFTLWRLPQRVHPKRESQRDFPRTCPWTNTLRIPRKTYQTKWNRRTHLKHSLKKSSIPETSTQIWRIREEISLRFWIQKILW